MKRRLFLLQIILILVALVSCNNSVDDVFDVVDASSVPFTMEFIEDGELTLSTTFGKIEMKYSKDGGKTFTQAEFKGHLGKYTCTIEVSAGDKISLYGLKRSSTVFKIGCTADCYIYGNMMSLVYSEDFEDKDTVPALAFTELFYENNHIKNHASNPLILPAANLGDSCYSLMFAYSSIQTAPILPATTLAPHCYEAMFKCSDLQTAPELPATTLAESCYFEMFRGCEYLTTVPQQLPAENLKAYCYRNMFYDCKKITTAPVLPAKSLVDYCYDYMFGGCENLSSVTCLAENKDFATEIPTNNWLKDVSDSGTFTKSANAKPELWPLLGPSYIPNGWNVIEK